MASEPIAESRELAPRAPLPPSYLVRPEQAMAIPCEQLGWPARRFRALEELGEPTDIIFRRYTMDGRTIDEELLKHESHDGVGGFAALIQSRGVSITSMPSIGGRMPPLLRRLLQLVRHVRAARCPLPIYKETPDWSVTGAWPSSAIAILDVARTRAFVESARKRNATVTTVLLSSFDRHAAKRLLIPGSARRWMVPVNRRTADQAHRYDNVATALMIPFFGDRTPEELRDAMKKMLDAGLHWGPTALVPLLTAVRYDKLKARLADFRPSRSIFGYLSNLGAWPPPGTIGEERAGGDGEAWAVIPPVTRRGPLSCTVLSYRGSMALCAKAHGALRLDANDVRELLSLVADDVAALCGGVGKSVVFSDERSSRSGGRSGAAA